MDIDWVSFLVTIFQSENPFVFSCPRLGLGGGYCCCDRPTRRPENDATSLLHAPH